MIEYPCGHEFNVFTDYDPARCPVCGPIANMTPLQLADCRYTSLVERHTRTGEAEMALLDAGKELVRLARAAAFEEAAKLCEWNARGLFGPVQGAHILDAQAIRRRATPATGGGNNPTEGIKP